MSSKTHTKEYWDRKFKELYDLYEFPFLKFTYQELANKFNISKLYFNQLALKRNLSIRNDYKLLFKKYDTEKYTLKSIIKLSKINKTVSDLRKYLKKYEPDRKTKNIYKDISKDIKEAIDELYEEYEFPILKKGYKWIAEYLGYSPNVIYKVLKKYNRTKEKEYKTLFKRYKPYQWSSTELAEIAGVSTSTILAQLQKLYGNKSELNKKYNNKTSIYSAKSMIKMHSKYGLVNDLNKLTSNQFYYWVERKFNTDGKFTIKEARKQGIKRVGVYMQIIKKKYNLEYYYDHNTATYYKGSKKDV